MHYTCVYIYIYMYIYIYIYMHVYTYMKMIWKNIYVQKKYMALCNLFASNVKKKTTVAVDGVKTHRLKR